MEKIEKKLRTSQNKSLTWHWRKEKKVGTYFSAFDFLTLTHASSLVHCSADLGFNVHTGYDVRSLAFDVPSAHQIFPHNTIFTLHKIHSRTEEKNQQP